MISNPRCTLFLDTLEHSAGIRNDLRRSASAATVLGMRLVPILLHWRMAKHIHGKAYAWRSMSRQDVGTDPSAMDRRYAPNHKP
jgi:hypothetical protein